MNGSSAGNRWLLFIMQLPTRPAAPRLKVWRRLQQIGSVALRGSVYVLPNTEQAREDFEWLRGEVMSAAGQASILAAEALTAEEHASIVQAFRDAREQDFRSLAASVKRANTSRRVVSSAARRAAERTLGAARQRLTELEMIDFGGSSARADAARAIAALAARLSPQGNVTMADNANRLTTQGFRERTWVTRPRPGVDRMSSAWLIRRFIDPKARFEFRAANPAKTSRDIPFDMFGVEFGHQGDRCTFEVLAHRFRIDDAAVTRIGEIVHDVDLKDQRYRRPESPVVHELIEGLRHAYPDDHTLLDHGMAIFGGLFESFAAAEPPSGKPKRSRR